MSALAPTKPDATLKLAIDALKQELFIKMWDSWRELTRNNMGTLGGSNSGEMLSGWGLKGYEEQWPEPGESTYGLPVSSYKFWWKYVMEGLTTYNVAVGRWWNKYSDFSNLQSLATGQIQLDYRAKSLLM